VLYGHGVRSTPWQATARVENAEFVKGVLHVAKARAVRIGLCICSAALRPTSRAAVCLSTADSSRPSCRPPYALCHLPTCQSRRCSLGELATAQARMSACRAVEIPRVFRLGIGAACRQVPRRPQAGHNDCGRAASWASHSTAAVPPHRVLSMPPTLRRRFPRRVPEAAGQGMRADSRTCAYMRVEQHTCRHYSPVYILECTLASGTSCYPVDWSRSWWSVVPWPCPHKVPPAHNAPTGGRLLPHLRAFSLSYQSVSRLMEQRRRLWHQTCSLKVPKVSG
jgi:hypothetical protein